MRAELLQLSQFVRISAAGDNLPAVTGQALASPSPIPELAPVINTLFMMPLSSSRCEWPSPAQANARRASPRRRNSPAGE